MPVTPINPAKFISPAKQLYKTGGAIDSRSQYLDVSVTPNIIRDYVSTTEALAYLSNSNTTIQNGIRSGGFEVYINSTGTLTNGLIVGGSRDIYWFKDGVVDNSLVLKSSLTPDATSSIKGSILLTGDLGGTADSPTVPGLATNATAINLREIASNKDATGGYVGLTLFKINFKNVLNTFTSFFTNANTAARTYTFQDRDGTISDNTDLNLKANKLTTINTITNNYTLLSSDNNTLIVANKSTEVTITIPTGLTAGFSVIVKQKGAGKITFAGSGTTIESEGGLVSSSGLQNSIVTLIMETGTIATLGGSLG